MLQDSVSPQPHNPFSLSPIDYQSNKGYRLLDTDEIGSHHRAVKGVELYCPVYTEWLGGFAYSGSDPKSCYRTKLTRDQLRNLRAQRKDSAHRAQTAVKTKALDTHPRQTAHLS